MTDGIAVGADFGCDPQRAQLNWKDRKPLIIPPKAGHMEASDAPEG